MGIDFAAMLKTALVKGLKLFTPADYPSLGSEEMPWIKDLQIEGENITMTIEVDRTLFNVWLAANGRIAAEEFQTIKDFTDLVLDADVEA